MNSNFADKRIVVGDVVKHFKRELLSPDEDKKKYLYEVLSIAYDCSHNEYVVVYKPLYEEPYSTDTYVREIEEFFSEVDHNKYPKIKQKYRFERI